MRKITVLMIAATQFFCFHAYAEPTEKPDSKQETFVIKSLEQCLDMAIKNNRQRRISEIAVSIAESQHKQALSAYWPWLKAEISGTRSDDEPNFVFPSEVMRVMGVEAHVPEKDVKLMNRDLLISNLEFIFPLYTGGKRTAHSKRARIGVEIAKESARQTDIKIIYDVKRMYYGFILAANLRKFGRETLDRFDAAMKLTEHLYQHGEGVVKKTDYLRSKVMKSFIMAMQESLISNEKMAGSALVNAMGLEWHVQPEPVDKEIPFTPFDSELAELITDAYQFNPDWSRLEKALKVAEAEIKKAKSGHFPIIALTGRLSQVNNSYDKGIVTDVNRKSWNIGIGVRIPLFSGFLTTNQIREAAAKLEKMKHEKMLLKEGIALRIKDAFLKIMRAQGQIKATEHAVDAARENRELNIRAYQYELVETREVIEAQLMESFVQAQHVKALYDHAVAKARLDYIVGREIEGIFKP
ncbi:MAG: TolC family protein [Desulfobacteraceae bacterium]|nr:TolC family protein [Desulfobacteraceae bacterium]